MACWSLTIERPKVGPAHRRASNVPIARPRTQARIYQVLLERDAPLPTLGESTDWSGSLILREQGGGDYFTTGRSRQGSQMSGPPHGRGRHPLAQEWRR